MRQIASPAQLRASLLRWCLVTVPGIVALGFVSGRAGGSGPDNPWFAELIKPGIFPPPATFGIVWTILYIMMGVALALVITARGAPGRGIAITAFLVQLAVNLSWSPLFFAAHEVRAALYLICVLILLVFATIVLLVRIRPMAGVLLVPYLVWCVFAAFLNYEFDRLNPGASTLQASGAAAHIEFDTLQRVEDAPMSDAIDPSSGATGDN